MPAAVWLAWLVFDFAFAALRAIACRPLFVRLMSRGITDHLAEDEPVIRELFDPLAHAFIDAMAAAVPQATRGQIAWCYQFALGALLHHVIDERVERLSPGSIRRQALNGTTSSRSATLMGPIPVGSLSERVRLLPTVPRWVVPPQAQV